MVINYTYWQEVTSDIASKVVCLKVYYFPCQCTKIYPMALMFLNPLSAATCLAASFPHVLELSGFPPVPNPILESQVLHVL